MQSVDTYPDSAALTHEPIVESVSRDASWPVFDRESRRIEGHDHNRSSSPRSSFNSGCQITYQLLSQALVLAFELIALFEGFGYFDRRLTTFKLLNSLFQSSDSVAGALTNGALSLSVVGTLLFKLLVGEITSRALWS